MHFRFSTQGSLRCSVLLKIQLIDHKSNLRLLIRLEQETRFFAQQTANFFVSSVGLTTSRLGLAGVVRHMHSTESDEKFDPRTSDTSIARTLPTGRPTRRWMICSKWIWFQIRKCCCRRFNQRWPNWASKLWRIRATINPPDKRFALRIQC